jgi:hypothetical protein
MGNGKGRALAQPGLSFKPQRLGTGQTMTVAVFDGEYRIANAEKALDLDATVRVLKAAGDVLSQAQSLR